LDKIIDRAQTQASAPVTAPTPQAARQPTYVAHDDDDDDRYKKKRKSSLLGELFDF
jgi:Zn-finger nucleic acid-binding protein